LILILLSIELKSQINKMLFTLNNSFMIDASVNAFVMSASTKEGKIKLRRVWRSFLPGGDPPEVGAGADPSEIIQTKKVKVNKCVW